MNLKNTGPVFPQAPGTPSSVTESEDEVEKPPGPANSDDDHSPTPPNRSPPSPPRQLIMMPRPTATLPARRPAQTYAQTRRHIPMSPFTSPTPGPSGYRQQNQNTQAADSDKDKSDGEHSDTPAVAVTIKRG